ncbi:glutamate--tRNA ligase [Pedomonas mirosovicensis]|uniref:glutamate--tRNA ligase n=1 Tax=Pedomonas mirosovicensis TaxID=2908641 RepID=UPI002168D5E5|nr:glutamate--tRNA ligase [Pedomonas mirosovicensis]MCH8685634.1 glutamate--tRNA ligase [Pedomonas mirosovicensis]
MTENPTVVRFAPSPTGFLHVGNLRTAIINALFAEKTGGRFLLRLDDTDQARSREEYVDGIRRDLAWLGIRVDGEERQSQRTAAYEAAFERLKTAGRVYPCYETAEELDIRRKIQLSRGLPPVYDRAGLKLTDDERAKLEAEGRRPHWRFKLETDSRIAFDDLVQGHVSMDPASLSDPVVRREDGSWLYMLPSVIDDVDMGITHVVRGQDHLTNSAVQLQMFEALGAKPPAFAHLALLSTKSGELSKRLGSAGVEHYKALGVEPLALIAYLARLGTSLPIEPVTDRQALVETFDWSRFNKANALFDEADLTTLNTKILHHLDFADVQDRLPEGMTAEDWLLLRGNVNRLDEIAAVWKIVTGPIAPVIEDVAFIETARAVLDALPWADDIWKRWTGVLKERTGRKGKELFLPLRLALTGEAHGPEMGPLLVRIGREAALERLCVPQ